MVLMSSSEWELSDKFYAKLIQSHFKDIGNDKIILSYLRWIIDSKYRIAVKLNEFLNKQLGPPTKKVTGLVRKQAFNVGTSDTIIVKILKWVSMNIKYQTDNYHYGKLEYWASSVETLGRTRGDCLSWDTKLLKPDMSTIIIEDINIGDYIIGKDGKSVKVLNKIDKGIIPCKNVLLRNGTCITATDDHKFILSTNQEILCKDLKLGMVLKEPNNIEYNLDEEINKDYWYLKGLYVADGWIDNCHKDVFISGKDGFKKEKQKEWVKQYCIKNSISYRWDLKSICIHSRELYKDFKLCGRHAINKHVDLIPSKKENIEALLEGLKADAHICSHGSICYGTISEQLKEQIVLLYRLLGISCYVNLVKPTKTQFGYNDIYRIYPRIKKNIPLKITGIIEYGDEPVYDITVEDKEIYLPGNDCMIHNCDDMNSLIYILGRASGIPSYQLYCAIGDTIVGGHFWILYYSTTYNKMICIDSTLYPNLQGIEYRNAFNTDQTYKKIWYVFNEDITVKFKNG